MLEKIPKYTTESPSEQPKSRCFVGQYFLGAILIYIVEKKMEAKEKNEIEKDKGSFIK